MFALNCHGRYYRLPYDGYIASMYDDAPIVASMFS